MDQAGLNERSTLSFKKGEKKSVGDSPSRLQVTYEGATGLNRKNKQSKERAAIETINPS